MSRICPTTGHAPFWQNPQMEIDGTTARATLEYRGDSIDLHGETLIGRGLECRIRFNDATVSRSHLRLTADAGGVTAEDLGSTNGTQINGQSLSGVQPLADGDTLQVGNRSLGVRIVSELDDDRGTNQADACDQQAMPTVQTCPRCRTAVSINDEVCTECGYRWPPGRAMSLTVKIPVSGDRRRHPRILVDIPGLYTSPLIICDATATDLSRGGVFVTTEIVDAIDTPCQLILLPDGSRATAITGVVRRVVDATGNGHPSGMAIQFIEVDDATAAALASFLTI